jgi:fructokinase
MPEIVTVGELLVDVLAETVGQPLSAPGRYLGPYPSGAPAIFADQAARLGVTTAIAGAVGADAFGEAVLGRLRASGVDIGAVRVLDDATTGVAFATYFADGSREFLFHMKDAAPGRFRAEDVTAALFAGCRIFHIMGSSLFSAPMIAAITRGITLAEASGAEISFDPNIRPALLRGEGVAEAIHAIARRADILLPSEDDLAFLCPGQEIEAALDTVLSWRARRVFLKLGAAGSRYADRDQRLSAPPFATREIDPTGAGDCAGATFLASLLRDLPLERCLARANAAGALAVAKRGPMEGNSDEATLTAFIADAAKPAPGPAERR